MSRIAVSGSAANGSGGISSAESVNAVCPPISPLVDSARIFICWQIIFNNIPTGTTSIVWRLRRGIDTTGVLLNTLDAYPCTVGTNTMFSGCWIDVVSQLAQVQYCLTTQCNAASASGNCHDACIFAMVL